MTTGWVIWLAIWVMAIWAALWGSSEKSTSVDYYDESGSYVGSGKKITERGTNGSCLMAVIIFFLYPIITLILGSVFGFI